MKDKSTKATSNRLVLSTKYCDNAHKIRRLLTDCWKELHKSKDLREIFPSPPMLAFKRHPSLRNKLVKAKLPTTENSDNVQETTEKSPNTLSQICGTSTQLMNPNIPIYMYTGKQPPTFQQQKRFPFKLFPQRKMIKPCFKKQCETCKILIHTSNFVKKQGTQKMFPSKATPQCPYDMSKL